MGDRKGFFLSLITYHPSLRYKSIENVRELYSISDDRNAQDCGDDSGGGEEQAATPEPALLLACQKLRHGDEHGQSSVMLGIARRLHRQKTGNFKKRGQRESCAETEDQS